MRDLALELGQLPLVQLLMAEFALQPCSGRGWCSVR